MSIMRLMEKIKDKFYQLGLGVLLPVLAGCNGGGGSGAASSFSSVGSLFAGSDSGSGATGAAGSTAVASIASVTSLTTSALTNPEPASLLLLGGGLVTLGYLKGLKKKFR